jgi:preprotein translocase subunit YajC
VSDPAVSWQGNFSKLLLAKSTTLRRFGGSYLETMTVHSLFALLAFAPSAQPGTTPNPQGQIVQLVAMVAIMGFLMYFIIIRPQRSRQKQLDALMKNLKPGDRILTGSGIVGVVIGVKEKTVSIRSADSKLEVLKSTISEITEKAGEAAQA